MFKHLHIKFTLFFTAASGLILVTMTVICLMLSENAARKNNYISFVNTVNNVTSYAESQTVISYSWLARQEQGSRYTIALYDRGRPLFINSLMHGKTQLELTTLAKETALEKLGFDVDVPSRQKFVTTEYFTMTDNQGTPYYCTAAIIPKSGGALHALILYSRAGEMSSILRQRLLFVLLDLAALLVLGVFCWFFTRRIIRPVEDSRRKQVQFIASASHELRAPLTVVLSGCSALKKADPENAPRFLSAIRQETIRMSHLVDEMLSLANSDAHSWNMKRVPTQMDTLVLNAYEKYEILAKEQNISLTISLPEDSPPDCVCDGERISQVLSILLDNALNYTPANGQVNLSLTYESAKYVLRVADDGPGIPDEQKALIFERFYRGEASHTSKSHFGLGLCIAKEIVSLHRGKIWVDDAPDGGSVFTFFIGGKGLAKGQP